MIEDQTIHHKASSNTNESNDFIVYPAIDLRHGQVVRLVQGDPARQTTYGNNPADVALRWLERGARWLHVVNLDGAFGEGGAENLNALSSILKIVSKMEPVRRIQFGGGLRAVEDIDRVISMGVSRVMLGSIAVESPDIFNEALSQYGSDTIGLAMDVRAGEIRIRGWTQSTAADPFKVGQRLFIQGLRFCAYTDISRDGGGGGLNLRATERFAEGTGLDVIASGGVDDLDDIRKTRSAGLSGVIVGRALYEGRFELEQALAC